MIPHLSQLWSDLSKSRKHSRPAAAGKLGTFIGVYTPTILTILGVIMYLRFGWAVGHVGLWRALLIVLLANTITCVNALSLSAVATNSRVGIGGAHFIVSRSPGLEIGGAIGIPLFLSQALSVTPYAYGLAESLRFAWPGIPAGPPSSSSTTAAMISIYRDRIRRQQQNPPGHAAPLLPGPSPGPRAVVRGLPGTAATGPATPGPLPLPAGRTILWRLNPQLPSPAIRSRVRQVRAFSGPHMLLRHPLLALLHLLDKHRDKGH